MRRIAESGGLELGPPEGPWLDLVPAPGGFVSLFQARLALKTRIGLWESWEKGFAAELSPLRDRGLVGITGLFPEDGLMVLFRYRPELEPAEALRRIAEAEGEQLPPEPVAAALAAALALRAGRSRGPRRLLSPWALARLAARVSPQPGETQPHRVLAALARGEPPPLPADPVGRAVTLIRAARTLWEPALLAAPPEPATREALADLALLAAADLELRPRRAVALPSGIRAPLRVEGPAEAAVVWPAAAEWGRGGLGQEALAFLWGDRPLPPERAEAPVAWAPGPEAAALRAALVEAAERDARYAPVGPFLVRPPAGLFTVAGARLRVWVDGEGLWAAVEAGERVLLPPCRWEPDRPFKPFLDPETPPGLDLVLAALWHDLRTAGPQAFPQREGRPAGGGDGDGTGRPGTGPRVRSLPQPLRLAGERTWGPVDEGALRRAHGVRGHLRRLRPGWSARAKAAEAARAFGLVLPKGYTFVRPHVRGRERGAKGAEAPEVRARGLLTLLVLGGGKGP